MCDEGLGPRLRLWNVSGVRGLKWGAELALLTERFALSNRAECGSLWVSRLSLISVCCATLFGEALLFRNDRAFLPSVAAVFRFAEAEVSAELALVETRFGAEGAPPALGDVWLDRGDNRPGWKPVDGGNAFRSSRRDGSSCGSRTPAGSVLSL